MSVAERKWGRVFSALAVLFIAELILGFNGKMLLIRGIPVRMMIYAAFLLALTLMIRHACRKGTLSFNLASRQSVWRQFEPFDYALAAFLLLNGVWIFIIPHLSGYGIGMALEQTKSTPLLLLYFPLLVLIRTGVIRFEASDKIIKPCILVLALLHIVFYVGEWVRDDGAFVKDFFAAILSITFGHSESPEPVTYPLNYYRIVFPTSLFLLMIFYYTYKDKLSLRNVISHMIGVSAMAITFAKSLWLGVVVGAVFLAGYYVVHKIGKFNWKKIAVIAVSTVFICCVLDGTILERYLSLRIKHAFSVNLAYSDLSGRILIEDGVNEHLRSLDELDRAGRSNGVRIVQTRVLLNKWLQSPWVGFGYGSYAEEMIQGPPGQPFLYEMFLPFLLMQVGMIGVLIWTSYFAYLLWYAGRNAKAAAGVLFLVIAICAAGQFNPFILGAPAMSMFLYSLLVIRTAAPAVSSIPALPTVPALSTLPVAPVEAGGGDAAAR